MEDEDFTLSGVLSL